MNYITVTLKAGGKLLLNKAHIMSVMQLFRNPNTKEEDGCEIQMQTGLLFVVSEDFKEIADNI